MNPSPARRNSPRKRLLVIRNPTAGPLGTSLFQKIREILPPLGCTLTIRDTTAPGDAEIIAREALAADFDAVVAAGGDGTVNEVINGLGPSSPPLAVIPMGTANVLALEMGLPQDADIIARTIVYGRGVPVFPGVVNGRRFILMSSIGFDAHAVATVSSRIKRHLGKGAYIVAVLGGIFSFSYPRYRVEADGRTFEATSVVVAKARSYGGPYTCTPEAELEEARLYICVLKGPGRWNMARYGLALLTGRLPELPDVEVFPVSSITLDGPKGSPVQVDGDIRAELPARIGLSETPLALIYPP